MGPLLVILGLPLLLQLLPWPLGAAAQPRPVPVPRTEERIGSWVLSCATDPMTDARACRLRHGAWVVPPRPGHPGLALEVERRGERLVPMVAVRDLTLESALNALLALTATAQLRFGGNRMIELPCSLTGRTVICAPTDTNAAAAAEQLPAAVSVLVRLKATPPLPVDAPEEPVALDLDRTAEALARFRAAAPASTDAGASSQGLDLRGLADRLMRALGLGRN